MTPRNPIARADLIVESMRWYGAISDLDRLVQRACQMVRRFGGINANQQTAPSLLFSDDQHVKKLNFQFRGKNKPTNVLTFEPLSPQHGGDIVLAYETMKREADKAQRPLRAHVTHLLVHGLLHLAGHDHLHPGEARRMETLETYIMRRMGFPDPWKTGAKPHA